MALRPSPRPRQTPTLFTREVNDMEIQTRQSRATGSYVGAIILIVIGVAALVANLGGSKYVEESVLLVLGAAFLVAYAFQRRYGYLVPGGIMTGFGAGVLASSLAGATDGGPYAVIGGGLGFLLIFAVDLLVARVSTRWWPVIPGGVLVLAGTAMSAGNDQYVHQLQVWSPVLLIALGLAILLARLRPAGR
jgi:hypothetical protein